MWPRTGGPGKTFRNRATQFELTGVHAQAGLQVNVSPAALPFASLVTQHPTSKQTTLSALVRR